MTGNKIVYKFCGNSQKSKVNQVLHYHEVTGEGGTIFVVGVCLEYRAVIPLIKDNNLPSIILNIF